MRRVATAGSNLLKPPVRLRTQQRAWGRLPHAWVRNPSIAAETVILLAYRVTFTGTWVSHATDLKTIVAAGFGRDVVERARANAQAVGYLKRSQPSLDPSGRYQLAHEQVLLPDCNRSNSQVIQRTWFEGTLTLKEMAILLMIRAGIDAGEGSSNHIQADQLARRFGWRETTVHASLKVLQALSLVRYRQDRDERGNYTGGRYVSLRMPFNALRGAIPAQPGHGDPGRGLSGHLRTRGYLYYNNNENNTPSELRFREGEIAQYEQAVTPDSKSVDQAIMRLRNRDFAKTLSPELLEDSDGLARFFHAECSKSRARGAKLTITEIVEAMERVLTRHAIDGKSVASVFTWRFFAGAINDEFPDVE